MTSAVAELPSGWAVVAELPDDGGSVEFIVTHEGETEVEGHVRWDGCVNWQTPDGTMAHSCVPADVASLAAALMMVWPLARRLYGDRADPLADWGEEDLSASPGAL